jgi:hypothetical protein
MALKALEEANTRVRKSLDGDDRTIGEESVKRKQSLNVLYMEMRAVGEASVRHRGGARFVDATPRLAASGNGQGSKPPRAPNTDSGAPETLDTPPVMKAAIARSNSKSRLSSMAMYDTADSSVKGSRFDTVDSSVGGGSANGEGSNRGNSTFMNVAHVHGLCSLDELIQACRSSGCEAMAGDLEGVKDQLREERVKDLVDSGLKTTNASNALLDTMLFRFHDLFQKVITKKAEHARHAKEAARCISESDEGGPTTTTA